MTEHTITAHTQGPWTLNQVHIEGLLQNEVVAPDGVLVHSSYNLRPFEEANARLIAAAPEMLEMLKALHDFHHDVSCAVIGADTFLKPLYRKTKAVIAKAEGEEQ